MDERKVPEGEGRRRQAGHGINFLLEKLGDNATPEPKASGRDFANDCEPDDGRRNTNKVIPV